MRHFSILLLIFTLSLADAYNTDWIDKAVEEIKPTRVGVDEMTIQRITNPFLYGVIKEKKVEKKKKLKYQKTNYRHSTYFKVSAILNNSAKVNNRWIDLGKKISGYTLSQIAKEYVILKKANKKPIKVYLNRKNNKIRLKTQ